MNNQMNKSQYEWYMSWFKKTVRYIVSDMEELPEIAAAFGYHMTESEKADLKEIMPYVKMFCIDMWNEYVRGEADIRNYVEDLRFYFKLHFETDLLFVENSEPAMSPDEPPYASYNSLHVNHEDLHFHIMEIRHDEYMYEMAETKGMGYEYIERLKSDDEECEGIENSELEDLPF